MHRRRGILHGGLASLSAVLSGGAFVSQCKSRKGDPGSSLDLPAGTTNASSSTDKLVLAQVVLRHGARSPLNSLPNKDEVNWDVCAKKGYFVDSIKPKIKPVKLDGQPRPASKVDER